MGILKDERSNPKLTEHRIDITQKYINQLEQKDATKSEGRRKVMNSYKKISKSSRQDKYNQQINPQSSKRTEAPERLLAVSHASNNKRKKNRNKSINNRKHLDPQFLEILDSDEPDPEPTSFCEVDGIISHVPENE